MKRVSIVFTTLLVILLLFACQNATTSSETAISPETSSLKTTLSQQNSSGELAETFVYEHIPFKTTQDLFDFLRQNSTQKSVNGANIQNFIKDNQIAIFEPTFTPPNGFHFYCVEIWTGYSAYFYVTDAYLKRIEERKSSAEAAAQAAESISIPLSSYETKDESSETIEKTSSGVTSSPTEINADLVFLLENELVIQWCTAVWDDPLTRVIENPAFKPLGNSENPKYYYSVNAPQGTPINYDVYWETDGHYCFARIPAALFSEEAVAEICSFKPVTVPIG